MNEISHIILILVAGIALGLFFFGGLWYTVKKVVNTKTPSIWFFLSYFLRISIILTGFYFVSSGKWQMLFICLLGFITGRIIVFRITKAIDLKQQNKEVNHET